MQSTVTALPGSNTLDAFAKTVLEHPKQSHFLVHDGDRIVGMVGREAAVGALDPLSSAKTLGQVANTRIHCRFGGGHDRRSSQRNVRQGRVHLHGGGQPKPPSIMGIQGIVTEYETADTMIRCGRFVLRLNPAENESSPSLHWMQNSEVAYVEEHSCRPGWISVCRTAVELGIQWAKKFNALLVGLGIVDEATIRRRRNGTDRQRYCTN